MITFANFCKIDTKLSKNKLLSGDFRKDFMSNTFIKKTL